MKNVYICVLAGFFLSNSSYAASYRNSFDGIPEQECHLGNATIARWVLNKQKQASGAGELILPASLSARFNGQTCEVSVRFP